MASSIIHTSGNDKWSQPRPYSDPSIRQLKHGRIRPMEEPTLLERWFGNY